MGENDKIQWCARIAWIMALAAFLVCCGLIEWPILNAGKVGLHRFAPTFSWLRTFSYLSTLAVLVIGRKPIERYLKNNQCLSKSKIYYFIGFGAVSSVCAFIFVYRWRLSHIRPQIIVVAVLLLLFMLWAVGTLFLGEKPENNFLIIGLLLVPLFSMVVQFNHGLDEPSHFAEAYSIMMGHFSHLQANGVSQSIFLSMGRNIPFYDFFTEYKIPVDYQRITAINVAQLQVRPAGYPVLFYLAQSFGLWIGKLLHFSAASEYYMGRLMNGIFYILLTYFAVRIMPIAKNLWAIIFLTPTLCAISCTYSIDGIGVGFVCLFAAICLSMAVRQTDLGWKDYLLLLLFAVPVFIFKGHAYMAAFLFVFLIPLERLLKRKRFIHLFYILFPILVVSVCLFGGYRLLHMPAITNDLRGGQYVNASAQFRNVLAHPLYVLDILLIWVRTAFLSPPCISYLVSINYFFGPLCNVATFAVGLWIFVALTDNQTLQKVTDQTLRKLKSFSIAYAMMTVFLIFLGLYLIYCNVGVHAIHGLQMRYLFPILPFLLLPLQTRRFSNTWKHYSSSVFFCSSLILVVSEFEMIISR